uniref:Uncharacterized protein n=1 Tax=Heliothis virescens TaxID=7102 RepID=A0A2A4J1K5_HELVI
MPTTRIKNPRRKPERRPNPSRRTTSRAGAVSAGWRLRHGLVRGPWRAIRSARPDARVCCWWARTRAALPCGRRLSKEAVALRARPGVARAHLDALSFSASGTGGSRSVAIRARPLLPAPWPAAGQRGRRAVWRAAGAWCAWTPCATRPSCARRAAKPVRRHYDKCLGGHGVRARRADALRDAGGAAARAGAARPVRRPPARLAQELERPGLRRRARAGGAASWPFAEARAAGRACCRRTWRPRRAGGCAQAGVAACGGRGGAGGRAGARGRHAAPGVGRGRARRLVVECVGKRGGRGAGARVGAETHPELGGLWSTPELQARTGRVTRRHVGRFYDVVLGARRWEHHDHAVVRGRLAGENMAGVAPPSTTPHQSMFWADLGPQARLRGHRHHRLRGCPPWGVFSADAVTDAAATAPLRRRRRRARAGGEAGALRTGWRRPDEAEARRRRRTRRKARRYERKAWCFYCGDRRCGGRAGCEPLFNRIARGAPGECRRDVTRRRSRVAVGDVTLACVQDAGSGRVRRPVRGGQAVLAAPRTMCEQDWIGFTDRG